jgi:hypothetical protein
MSGPSPVDVVFAQKASACVKAAGLDPKAIDLKSFRKLVPVIVTRAYENIYKEELADLIEEPVSTRDYSHNVQLVIDQLTRKTRNEALVTITGADIVSGDDFSVGVLIGVIYSEGHRMWLEKIGQRKPAISLENVRPRSRPVSGKSDNRGKRKNIKKQDNSINKTVAMLDEATQANFEDDNNKKDEEYAGRLLESSNFPVAPPITGKRSQNSYSPVRQKRIVVVDGRRIRDVNDSELDVLAVSTSRLDKSGRVIENSNTGNILPAEGEEVVDEQQQPPAEERMVWADADADDDTNAVVGSDADAKIERSKEGGRDTEVVRISVHGNAETYPNPRVSVANLRKGSVGRHINETRHEYHPQRHDDAETDASAPRRMRPTSAPIAGTMRTKKRPMSAAKTRIRVAQAAHDALFDRLYNTGRNRDVIAAQMEIERAALDAAYTGIMEEAVRKFERTFSPTNRKTAVDQEQRGAKEVEMAYTYDLLSGRKITLSQAEANALERRKKLEQYLNVKDISELNETDSSKKKKEGAGADVYIPAPTQPEWPGKSTGTSVEKWMQRMKISRGELPEEAPPAPRFYSAYNRLQVLDLIISVEHCHNCEHHSMTLRHDAGEYVRNADFMLRCLAQVVHGK